jgi:hypothetical protein
MITFTKKKENLLLLKSVFSIPLCNILYFTIDKVKKNAHLQNYFFVLINYFFEIFCQFFVLEMVH